MSPCYPKSPTTQPSISTLHSLLPALRCPPQPGSHCICTGKSSGCPAGDRHCRGQRSPPNEGEESREWSWAGPSLSTPFLPPPAHLPGFPGPWSHLAEWGPLVLSLGVEVLIGVCISEEHLHCAEFVQQPQADARGIPEPYCAILVPVGRARLPLVRVMPASVPRNWHTHLGALLPPSVPSQEEEK
jgi:hypothetical protein